MTASSAVSAAFVPVAFYDRNFFLPPCPQLWYIFRHGADLRQCPAVQAGFSFDAPSVYAPAKEPLTRVRSLDQRSASMSLPEQTRSAGAAPRFPKERKHPE